eukprot:scaffold40624_cov281-Isochrysis_galbana.AAC.1
MTYALAPCPGPMVICLFRVRSWAFGGERSCNIPATSRTMPANPAAGSACPALALKLPTESAP